MGSEFSGTYAVRNLRIFGLGPSERFAQQIAEYIHYEESKHLMCDLGAPLVGKVDRHHEERRPDGEAYTTAMDNVRGCDVFVVSSLFGDDTESVDEKFMKTAIFINTLRHASAERITLVCPYLCYMRQDRKTESRAPIATQAIAMMLEAVGVDRVLTMDVHNLGAEQNAFRIPIDNLEARKLLAQVIIGEVREYEKDRRLQWTVLTPDAGGADRTKKMQRSLSKRLGREVGIAYADKTRVDSHNVFVKIVGDVDRHNVIVVDDLISTGGTLAECQDAVERAGGVLWGVAATHGLYVDGAPEKLQRIPRIYATDTVSDFRLAGSETAKVVRTVGVSHIFAEAICRIHNEGGSISQLLNDD